MVTKICLPPLKVVSKSVHKFFDTFHFTSEVTQSCLTLCDPVDCSPLGSSVHGILQARILEWVAISFSRGSSQPRDRTRVSCIPGRRFTLCAAREALGAPKNKVCHSLHCSSEYNPSDFGVNHLVTSMCRVFSCVVGRGCLLWQSITNTRTLFLLQNANFPKHKNMTITYVSKYETISP